MRELFQSVLEYVDQITIDAVSVIDKGRSENNISNNSIYYKINPYLEELKKLMISVYIVLSEKNHYIKNIISQEDIKNHVFVLNDDLILSEKITVRTSLVEFFKEDKNWMFLIGMAIHGSGFFKIKPSGLFIRLKHTIYKHYGR